LRLERIAEVVVEGRNSAVLCDGPADQIHRHDMTADLVGEYAEKMQGICMVRIGLQNLPIKPLRFIQPPGLMMPQGGGEHLLNARRCLLPQVFSPIDSPWAALLITMDLGHHELILASSCA